MPTSTWQGSSNCCGLWNEFDYQGMPGREYPLLDHGPIDYLLIVDAGALTPDPGDIVTMLPEKVNCRPWKILIGQQPHQRG